MDQELKIGDILLFNETKGNFIDQCVAKLTDSEVCHAAMVYSEDALIEMGYDGVGVYGMEKKEGDSVHVMRMTAEPRADLLIKSANAYLDAKTIFNFPSLFSLAGLLVYRKLASKKHIFDISEKIIKAACIELDLWLQHIMHRAAPAFVCSQLVYQIYYNCESDYKIRIKDGILGFPQEGDEMRGAFAKIDFSENQPIPAQDLAKELLEALDFPGKESAQQRLHTPIHNAFHKRVIEIIEKSEIKIEPESLFVMPGDLLSHSINLKEVGKCDIGFKD